MPQPALLTDTRPSLQTHRILAYCLSFLPQLLLLPLCICDFNYESFLQSLAFCHEWHECKRMHETLTAKIKSARPTCPCCQSGCHPQPQTNPSHSILTVLPQLVLSLCSLIGSACTAAVSECTPNKSSPFRMCSLITRKLSARFVSQLRRTTLFKPPVRPCLRLAFVHLLYT